MTEREFSRALESRDAWGELLGVGGGVGVDVGDENVLRAARSQRAAQASAEPPVAPVVAETHSTLSAAALFACSQFAIHAGDAGRARVVSTAIPAGWMLFVGCVRREEWLPEHSITVPTPFRRALCAALATAEDRPRVLALVALAARLSWHGIKESILREAARSARALRDNELLSQVVAHYPGCQGGDTTLVLASEPCCETGPYRGRFVVLRSGDNAAHALVSAAAVSQAEGWETVWNLVHFANEVEAAPALLRRSLQEALEYDPATASAWREWIVRYLGNPHPLREELLGVLDAAPRV